MWKFSQLFAKIFLKKIMQNKVCIYWKLRLYRSESFSLQILYLGIEKMANTNPLKLRCCFQDGEDEKIFVIELCKKNKVTILKFAVKTLLANQGYQALSFNFSLYMNDPKENKLMESAEEISKYFNKPLVQDQIYVLIKSRSNQYFFYLFHIVIQSQFFMYQLFWQCFFYFLNKAYIMFLS